MTEIEWQRMIDESKKTTPIRNGMLEKSGIVQNIFSTGLLLIEGSGKMEFSDYSVQVDHGPLSDDTEVSVWDAYNWFCG